jgi:hypothetical protein
MDGLMSLVTFENHDNPTDPDYWPDATLVRPSTEGLMRNLVPYYWPLRSKLPRDGLISFDDLMEREGVRNPMPVCNKGTTSLDTSDNAVKEEFPAIVHPVKLYARKKGGSKKKVGGGPNKKVGWAL